MVTSSSSKLPIQISTAAAHDELVSMRLQTRDAMVRDSARLLEVSVASQNQ